MASLIIMYNVSVRNNKSIMVLYIGFLNENWINRRVLFMENNEFKGASWKLGLRGQIELPFGQVSCNENPRSLKVKMNINGLKTLVLIWCLYGFKRDSSQWNS